MTLFPIAGFSASKGNQEEQSTRTSTRQLSLRSCKELCGKPLVARPWSHCLSYEHELRREAYKKCRGHVRRFGTPYVTLAAAGQLGQFVHRRKGKQEATAHRPSTTCSSWSRCGKGEPQEQGKGEKQRADNRSTPTSRDSMASPRPRPPLSRTLLS